MAFTSYDLEELDVFLAGATDVVPYITVARRNSPPGSIALRHDIDHSLEKAHRFAQWEALRGYRSSYYVLTTADYWKADANDFALLDDMIEMGHEIGFHNDAMNAPGVEGDVVKASEYIKEQLYIIEKGLKKHYSLLGVADHGGSPYKNPDLWDWYDPESIGFEYEAYQLQKTSNTYISDNQGKWRSSLKHAQTFMLIHPTWWPV